MLTLPSMKYLHGLKNGLTDYCHQLAPTLSQAPILLVATLPRKSEHALYNKDASVALSNAVQRLRFLLSNQFNFRVVEVHPSPNCDFALYVDVRKHSELARRVGARHLCAVGNGTAMDLAKAITAHSPADMFNERIFVPATLTSQIVASSPDALLFDRQEETISLGSNHRPQLHLAVPTAVVVDDDIQVRDSVSLLACLAILLDCQRLNSADDEIRCLVEATSTYLTKDCANDVASLPLSHILMRAGELLSYGTSDHPRSIALAVAVSLLHVFPEYGCTAIMASLVPTLAKECGVALDPAIAKAVPRLITTETVDTLIRSIQTTQSLWNCSDASYDRYRSVLAESVLL